MIICSECNNKYIRLTRDAGTVSATVCECFECSLCHGDGYMIVEKNGGHTFRNPCDCRNLALKATGISDAMIPAKFINASFQTYIAKNPLAERALKASNDFLSASGESWILFTGPPGGGKTHLGVSIAKEIVYQGLGSCRFFEFSRLIATIRDGYSANRSELSVINPLHEYDVLIFDELGKGSGSDWERGILDLIISSLYNSGDKKVVFTSNYPLGDGKDSLIHRLGLRVYSRIVQNTIIIEAPTSDWRQRSLPDNLKKELRKDN